MVNMMARTHKRTRPFPCRR